MATSTILTYNLKRKNIIDKKLNTRKKLFLKKERESIWKMKVHSNLQMTCK